MRLTPLDIKRQEFKKVLRGFDPVEVETFLSMVSTEFEEAAKANKDLREKLIELETQLRDYKAIEKTLQQTLAHAQETSQKSIENSRQEAQLMLREAEMKASQILDRARLDLTRMKEDVSILKAKKDTLANRLKTLLNSELQLVKALEVDEEINPKIEDEPPKQSPQDAELDEIVKNLEK